MLIVLFTALGVGGATVIGSLIGFIFKNISQKFSDVILSFAAGVMLAAAIIELIVPSVDYGGKYGIIITVCGVFIGALALSLSDKIVPHADKMLHLDSKVNSTKLDKVMLFVLAIAIHNFPEGLAAGIGFGAENISQTMTIAGSIALQNIPEGLAVVAPMLAVGVSRGKTFLIAVLTGVIEIVGTFIGYFAISISAVILPFALAFAGGTMLYVIVHEIIPETHSHGAGNGETYALLIGFSIMLIMDALFV